eukprot:TRINITY_DN16678_c0_g2_i1.p1 TRINITY_DN16678_c0_g2~~TRINITY_DN16678_c0_g2_i1.p1  ORF type:complete len:925 (-),score=147.10 TRINITY_DN16678_c0_g2_i1:351-3059(-)
MAAEGAVCTGIPVNGGKQKECSGAHTISSMAARIMEGAYTRLGRGISRRPRAVIVSSLLVYAACTPGLWMLTGSSRILFVPVETNFMTQFVYQTSRFIRDYRRNAAIFGEERISALMLTPAPELGLASPEFLRFGVDTVRRIADLSGERPEKGESAPSFEDLCVRRPRSGESPSADPPCEVHSILNLLLGDDPVRAEQKLNGAIANVSNSDAVSERGVGLEVSLARKLLEDVPAELRPTLPLLVGSAGSLEFPGPKASIEDLARFLAAAPAAEVVFKLTSTEASVELERRLESWVEDQRWLPLGAGKAPGRISAYLASSLDDEVAAVTASALPLIGMTVLLMLGYSMVFLVSQTRWPGRYQFCLVLFGSSIPGLSSLAAFGLMGYCGRPANSLTILTPFVGLATGIDALFVMTSAFRDVGITEELSKALASAVAKGGFAITVTTATSFVACIVAAITAIGMPGFVSLHLTLATTVFMNWFGFMTLYPALMALNDRRISATASGDSSPDLATSSMRRRVRFDVATRVRHFISERYAPKLARCIVVQMSGVVVMFGLVGAGLALTPYISEGMPDRHFVTDASYLNDFFDDLNSAFDSNALVEVGLLLEKPDLGNTVYRSTLRDYLEALNSREDVRYVDCWPGLVAEGLSPSTEMSNSELSTLLSSLLNTSLGARYRSDASVLADGSVAAARCRIFAAQPLDGGKRARQAQDLVAQADNSAVNAIVWHSSWPTFVDIHINCKGMMHATMSWALLSVFCVLLILMPVHLAIMTGVCVSSVIMVLLGFMEVLGLTYNGVTYTISVVAIGRPSGSRGARRSRRSPEPGARGARGRASGGRRSRRRRRRSGRRGSCSRRRSLAARHDVGGEPLSCRCHQDASVLLETDTADTSISVVVIDEAEVVQCEL